MVKEKLILLVLLASVSAAVKPAAEMTWIDMEIWCEREPLVDLEGLEFPLPRQEAFNRLLEEARILFSYMIYGGAFSYTPSDLSRKVTEEYTIAPIHEIRWGDENLMIRSTRTENNKLYAIIRYNLRDFQAARITAWQSNIHPAVTGSGEGNLFKGYVEKITALENAIKAATRNSLQQQVFNKPRQISGEFLILDPPYTIIKAGKYITTARIKLNLKEITPYKNF